MKSIFKTLPTWLTPLLPYLAVGIGIFWVRNAWAALLGFHLAIVLALLFTRPQLPVITLFKSKHIRWIALSVILSSSVGIFLYFFWSSLGVARNLPAHVAALGLNPSNWMAFIVYFTVVNPLLEEYFWRGYLGSPTKKLYISDFIYAGFHALILLGSLPAASIVYSLTVLVLAGWFWRQMAREDGGLLACVLGHMAADFTILVTIYRMSM